MNSFRFLERGVNAEIERQIALLEAGEPVVQETLHFDPASGRLSSLRSKEEAHDYRYFPEPDLVPLVPTEEMLAAARAALPELPAERAARYERDWGLAEDPARLLAYEPQWGDYFETVATAGDDGKAAANWVEQLRARIGAEADPAASNVTPQALARLVALVAAKEVNAGAGRQVLDRLVGDRRRPGRDRRARGPRLDGRRRRAGRRRGRGDRRERGRGREGARRQRQGDGPDRRLRDARDQGPRRRRRGRPPDPRAARRSRPRTARARS